MVMSSQQLAASTTPVHMPALPVVVVLLLATCVLVLVP
jgi:hypothetical protein